MAKLSGFPYQALDINWEPMFFPEPLPDDPTRDVICQRRYRLARDWQEVIDGFPWWVRALARICLWVGRIV